MSEAYAREILRRNVAQICQIVGWNGINSSPLEILTHVLEKYILTIATQANRNAEEFNRTEPNLHDLGLALRDLHVQLPELAEYTQCVPPIPQPVNIEKFPIPKESNLNFLKPGSHEVVTRPIHVHEHLPPMYPEKEKETPVASATEIRQNGIDSLENSNCASPEISVTDSLDKSKEVFKRPTDPVSLPISKKPRLRLEEEERTREISSVMMTMSGFLSPAREGKLPEARAPTTVSEKHDKHKANSHHSNVPKVPLLEKNDKKSKKNKSLNGKIMKNKRKDKSHKGESSKSKESIKLDKYPPGHPNKSKDIHSTHHNHVTMPAPKVLPPAMKPKMPPPAIPPAIPPAVPPTVPPTIPPTMDPIRPVIKQEPIDPPQVGRNLIVGEEAIPVPRKIPISKSPLASNSLPVQSNTSNNSLIPEIEIKKEVIDEEEKLASQPDRSKINIFKRITNKSKEDKNTPEVVDKQSDSVISRLQHAAPENGSESRPYENVRVKIEEPVVNNNDNSAIDMSMDMDLTANEVINVDEDSMDTSTALSRHSLTPFESGPNTSINKSLQSPYSKVVARDSPKIKKERKHKEKKEKPVKLTKLEAKLIKQQQLLLAPELAKLEKPRKIIKPPKPSKSKNDSKLPQLPPGFPFFHTMPHGRAMMPGPGLIPTSGLIPGSDFLAGIASNPALRGLPAHNLLGNPFAPGLIPGPSFLPGGLGPGLPNHLMHMGNFPHTSRSSQSKIPPVLRRPSLEVIPVENDNDRSPQKSPMTAREKDRHDKHKPPTIPNILQKHKPKSHKDHKSNMFKMPPIHPDITIELNPPKMDQIKQEIVKAPQPTSPRSPIPEPITVPTPEPQASNSEQETSPVAATSEKDSDKSDKKKEKAHKKDKKDKDGIKIKKKKDKKDKNRDKSEKKKDKEEKQEIKDKIKKEKKEKKKDKSATDGLVPKLTLKLNSSNSNSPMPPSSPDVFKLNIKPVVKKEEDGDSSVKDEPISREHSRSPELAQISALVTRPPKQKHSKHNHAPEPQVQGSPPPPSPPRKNRPPSSQAKYKRILFKPLPKKGNVEQLDDDVSMIVDDAAPPVAPVAADKPSGPLPTPYYMDEQGNKIWVCPACGTPDNGSPMIGCDGCDCWYHWVCVGITEEPGATEDWFCKSCLAKRAAMALAGVTTSGKKRGRKPKGEKIRDCH